ncbi:hypothetical protein Q9966_008257 [Columba livia]|nr:hypothetical protein Q9966_008257 [Columba livia]
MNDSAAHVHRQLQPSWGDDHLWKMWALPDGNITMTGEGHADQLSGCCFYPRVSNDKVNGDQKERRPQSVSPHFRSALRVGTQLVTSSGDTTVQIWDFSKRGCVLTSEGQAHAVQHCSWHLCGDFMASASVDNTSKTYGILTVRDADIQCVAMKIQSTALSFFRSPTLLSLGLLTRLYLSGMPEWSKIEVISTGDEELFQANFESLSVIEFFHFE